MLPAKSSMLSEKSTMSSFCFGVDMADSSTVSVGVLRCLRWVIVSDGRLINLAGFGHHSAAVVNLLEFSV